MLRTASIALVLALGGCTKPSDPPAASAPAAPIKAGKDPATARKMIADGAVVVDVRSAEEFGEDHVKQATNIPVQDLPGRMAELDKLVAGDKSRPVVVYCAAGSRAAKAQAQLEAAGYTHVVNGGGLDDVR